MQWDVVPHRSALANYLNLARQNSRDNSPTCFSDTTKTQNSRLNRACPRGTLLYLNGGTNQHQAGT